MAPACQSAAAMHKVSLAKLPESRRAEERAKSEACEPYVRLGLELALSPWHAIKMHIVAASKLRNKVISIFWLTASVCVCKCVWVCKGCRNDMPGCKPTTNKATQLAD